MAYDDQSTYNKFRAGDCGCEGKHEGHHEEGCGCREENKCGCCPTGLVSVEDADGKNIACLSPNDAEQYMSNSFRCPDGYIRVLDTDKKFIACLTPGDYAIYKANL